VLLPRGEPHDIFDPSAIVPAAIEDDDFASRGETFNVALKEQLTFLPIGGGRQGGDAENPWADPLCKRFYGSAFAGSVAAFKHYNDSRTCCFDPVLQTAKFNLKLSQFFFVDLAVHLFSFSVSAVVLSCHFFALQLQANMFSGQTVEEDEGKLVSQAGHSRGPQAMIAILPDLDALAALLSLTALEIVLGIDNILFISILVSRCPPHQVFRARQIGLSLAFAFRVAMLFGLIWLMTLTRPLFSIFGAPISWRDIILIGGGLFLIAKATHEIHHEVEPLAAHADGEGTARIRTFGLLVVQLIVIDIVFSLDSIITAIGMVDQIEIMIAAILVAMIVMFLASGHVASFVSTHPTTKMLALAFLLLIGMALIADGFDVHVPRGYIYFAMAFASVVEIFNVLARRNRPPRP
jgi:predicted tellurium resistance membrane protein TerC